MNLGKRRTSYQVLAMIHSCDVECVLKHGPVCSHRNAHCLLDQWNFLFSHKKQLGLLSCYRGNDVYRTNRFCFGTPVAGGFGKGRPAGVVGKKSPAVVVGKGSPAGMIGKESAAGVVGKKSPARVVW